MAYQTEESQTVIFGYFVRKYKTKDMAAALRRFDLPDKSREVVASCFASYVFGVEASKLLDRAYDAGILVDPPGRLGGFRPIKLNEALRNPIVAQSVAEVRRRLNANEIDPSMYQEERVLANMVLQLVIRDEFNL